MKTLLLMLLLTSCGSSDDNSESPKNVPQAAHTPTPMVVAVAPAVGGPVESRTQKAYGTNICPLDGDLTCNIVKMDQNSSDYVVTVSFFDRTKRTLSGEKQYTFVHNGDPVLELALERANCLKMIHAEVTDSSVKLVHPGCGAGEIVIATWSK